MKFSLPTGLAAGLLALAATPALAAPANVTVRVEGATTTLVDSTRVMTTSQPVVRDGHDCSGTSAGGALDRAIAGNWAGRYYDGFGHFVTAIAGEDYSSHSTDGWVAWVNHRSLTQSLCAAELQEGDEVLLFVDRCEYDEATQNCRNPVRPLGLSAPASATQGATTQVSVVRYEPDGTSRPAAGARVTGPGVDATTDAAGIATVAFAAPGDARIRAELAGSARSESRTVVVAAAGAPPAPVPVPAPDRSAPIGAIAALRDGQVLGRGPRQLRGSFTADPSGIRVVKLRLTKRLGKRCWYFSGRRERFRGARCGRGAYFAIGDRADWSYLLPERLGPGRYVLDAIAVDGAYNRTPLERQRTRVVFTVR